MLDDWTSRQLRSENEVAPKILKPDRDRDRDVDRDKNVYTSSDDEESSKEEFYLTKKKKKLKGKRLKTFNEFWEVFDYKYGKAEAADAWLEISVLTERIVNEIMIAAKAEAKRRPDLKAQDKTPKMAQGWLSARRWEDEIDNTPQDGLQSWYEQKLKEGAK